ncbi:GTPase-activating gyp7-like protein, putative [Medicago truncatula]|uniref:GTPase-activating gyp7-like protein, putative n=1 Tax=Medicago truncatula TaxID=3880 RepID=G7KBF7_MEDTR|nr:GTPase-activating gyp7-like protein, putative [Medicago truncatula]
MRAGVFIIRGLIQKYQFEFTKRKRVLSPQQWESSFAPDGRIRNRGKLLKRVRRGGVDPSIRAEVWPFLLGVYGLDTTKDERDVIRTQNRKKYEKLGINTFF